jgi:CBS domain containing-hemolysin-like protein
MMRPHPSIKKIIKRLPLKGRSASASNALNQSITFIDGAEHATEEASELSEAERVIFRKMVKLRNLTVSDVMVPRSDIVAVEMDITLTELKEVMRREQHSRMPVYSGTLDRLKGFMHIKDVIPALAGDEPFDMEDIMRDIYVIPPSMKLLDVLVQMRSSGQHLAAVVDEYGGIDGIVTLEDVFEALVGDIQDEHDDGVPALSLRRIASHHFDIPARMRVDDAEEEIGVNLHALLPDEDYDTIGGLIVAKAQRIPRVGEVIDMGELGHFKIIEADGQRIHRVHLTLCFTPLAA